MTKKIDKAHPRCRPPRDAKPINSEYDNSEKLWRLGDDGRWREDNGEPALAFIGSVKGEAVAWVADCKCAMLNGCALGKAFTFSVETLDLGSISAHRRRPMSAVRKR